MKSLSLKEKEYRLSLLRTERRAIIPLKWFVWSVTAGLWVTLVEPVPSRAIIAVFSGYALLNFIESYQFYFRRTALRFVRGITLGSYAIDVLFVTLLIYFNLGTRAVADPKSGPFAIPSYFGDFYILYFLLVMRGFALFTSFIETAFVNTLISFLFVLVIRMQQTSFAFVAEPAFAVRLMLIWLVLLMGWFIIVVLNQQKMDLIRVHEQIMRAESLVRMGELAAGVAHEINNPIGIIIANTEYLKTSVEPGHPMLDDLEAIHRESNRCRDIVQQMLAYANPKPGGITRVDARALNDEVLQFVFPRGHAGSISVVKDYSGAPPHIMADPNLVKQALLNLYINARQSIPEGEAGTITVRVHATKFPAAAIIEIEDTGIGIPSEDLAQVFDPFFSRKPKGTGLGLAMTHRIVDSFGGTITIANAHPRGTIVTMKFPPALDS